MSAIEIRGVARRFGELQALDGVDLGINQGEFFSLLGPSGCGKTTLLNIIAGFLAPSAGTVAIGGRDITALAPYQRDIGMVFQNYALFPHLTVADNVAYGLRVRKVKGAEIGSRVAEMLALVRLSELGQRMPHQLSGGQQQRVAIARALAIRPQVLLLDEPLSNLDAKLRREMQAELRRLQRDVGITTVMVTHDQQEALGLSDRIGILGSGRLQQVGTPLALYRQPANRFVGQFVGQANLLPAQRQGDGSYLARDVGSTAAPLRLAAEVSEAAALFLLRPERIQVALQPWPQTVNTIAGTLREASYTGAGLQLAVAIEGGGELTVDTPEAGFTTIPAPGTPLYLAWQASDLALLPDAGAAA